MTTPGTLPYASAASLSSPARKSPASPDRPGFWRAPFSGAGFREIAHTLTSLPVAIAGFTFAVTMVSLGAGLAVTVLGLPVLAATLAAARGLGAAERARARGLLGLDVAGPDPVRRSEHAGWWSSMVTRLGDAAGWKALLFQIVMFPWRVAEFCVSLTLLVTGWTLALYPAYKWVFPRYVGWPGYRLYDYHSGGVHHAYYLSSSAQIAGASLLGLAIVFLTPQVVRAMTNVERAAVRSLLG